MQLRLGKIKNTSKFLIEIKKFISRKNTLSVTYCNKTLKTCD